MIKIKDDTELLNKAVRAMRKAVKKVIAEHKVRKQSLAVWQNGKVVKIPPHKIT